MQTHPVRPRIVVAVCLLVACLAACTSTDSSSQPRSTETEPVGQEPTAAWVVFQGEGDGRAEVMLIRGDGSHLHPLVSTLEGGDQTNPDWDPTGTRLVFVMNDGSTDDLWVTDVGGTQPRRLLDCVAPCLYIDDPSWSPDGRTVAFSRTVDRHGSGLSTLEVVDVATGETEVLLRPSRREFTAGVRWSPDGESLVFELVRKVDRGVDSDISGVTLSIVGRHSRFHAVRHLTDPALFAATADWSPDGRWIVYSALPTASDESPDLFVVRPGGGTPRRVTHLIPDGGYAAEPAFTRDSQAIVFSGRTDSSPGEGVLLTVSLDGTEVRSAFGQDLVHGRHPRLQPTP